MYRFDRKLRLLLFNEIEKIEVAFRSALVHLVSHHLNDMFCVTNKQYFKNRRYFVGTKALNDAERRKSKEDFISTFGSGCSGSYGICAVTIAGHESEN